MPRREITKPLVPIGKATTLLVEVLGLLCKGMVSAWGSRSCWLLPQGLAAGAGVQVGMRGLNPSATSGDGRGHPLLCLGHGGGMAKPQYLPPWRWRAWGADANCLSVLQSQKTAGKLWRDGGLSWKEFLPEDQDVNKFVTEQVGAQQRRGAEMGYGGTLEVQLPGAWCSPVLPLTACLCPLPQKLEYTMGDSSDTPSRKELTSEELCKQMDKLLKENPNNQRIHDWIEVRVWVQRPWVWGLPPGSVPTSQPLYPPSTRPT